MTRIKLLYIHRSRDRHGTWRHYFRRKGYRRATLPGLPGSAEFMRAYEAALAAPPMSVGADRTAPGSMAALAASFYRSSHWTAKLGPATQANHRRIIERFLAEHGDKPVALLRPKHVREFLDDKAGTPAAANRLLSILRLLMVHAVQREMREDDPTRDVRRVEYDEGGFTTWTEDDIAAFEARWPVGTRARLAFALMLHTGQRRSDVIRMGRQHVRRGKIEVQQQKTGARLRLPIHPELQAVLDACPADHLTFLMTEAGKPFASGNAFYNWFKACCAAAGLAGDLAPHGLRKATARRLAEARCSPHEIMAVTGHTTLAEVERYTRAVEQERMAEGAIARIGGKVRKGD